MSILVPTLLQMRAVERRAGAERPVLAGAERRSGALLHLSGAPGTNRQYGVSMPSKTAYNSL